MAPAEDPPGGPGGRVELYRSLLQAQSDLGEGVAIIQLATGRFLYVNEALCGIYGYSADELMALPTSLDLLAPEVRASLQERFARRQREGDVPDHYETVAVHKDGHRVHIEVAVERIGSGKSATLVSIVRDVGERKRAEAELAEMYARERNARLAAEGTREELESFTHAVSHDLSDPLLVILGYVDLLLREKDDLLDADSKMYLNRILTNGTYMHALIDDLLELSRVGRLDVETQEIDIDDLVMGIADELRLTHPAATVHTADLPVVVMNPVRARQLFGNLLRNALEHSGRDDVHIDLRGERGPLGSALVRVIDDGRGIDRRYLTRVFGVFERLGEEGAQGTGIGLTICKKIVESVGGTIWAAEVARGATIVVELPPGVVHPPARAPVGETA